MKLISIQKNIFKNSSNQRTFNDSSNPTNQSGKKTGKSESNHNIGKYLETNNNNNFENSKVFKQSKMSEGVPLQPAICFKKSQGVYVLFKFEILILP